ncbi:FixH family protein [Achromobacter anxifer]
MTAAQPAKTVKPWYREPWPWILMAGPFAAMIGCFVTIYFAFTNFSSQPIQEGVVKRGLVIEQAASSVNP